MSDEAPRPSLRDDRTWRDPPAGASASEEGGELAWGGVHWGSPPVILTFLAVIAAAAFALRSSPPEVAPAPELALEAGEARPPPEGETLLYAVDEAGLAHPVVVVVPLHEDPSERLQALVDALRATLVEDGVWPGDLPAPTVHAFLLERRQAAVLDLPAHDVDLDVARERSVIESLRRTLLEAGVERLAFLRDGRSVPAWLGGILTPGGFD